MLDRALINQLAASPSSRNIVLKVSVTYSILLEFLTNKVSTSVVGNILRRSKVYINLIGP